MATNLPPDSYGDAVGQGLIWLTPWSCLVAWPLVLGVDPQPDAVRGVLVGEGRPLAHGNLYSGGGLGRLLLTVRPDLVAVPGGQDVAQYSRRGRRWLNVAERVCGQFRVPVVRVDMRAAIALFDPEMGGEEQLVLDHAASLQAPLPLLTLARPYALGLWGGAVEIARREGGEGVLLTEAGGLRLTRTGQGEVVDPWSKRVVEEDRFQVQRFVQEAERGAGGSFE